MGNALFESQITYTKDYVKEYLRACFKKSNLWAVFFLLLAPIIVGITLIIENKNDYNSYTPIIGAVVLGLLLLLVILIRYYKGSSIIYARVCEGNNGQDRTNIVQFSDDNILLTNSMTENKTNYSYSLIKQIIISKNLIILITEAKLIIAVEKTKFTIGTPNELISFIKSKISDNKKKK